ncbi:SHOCT domain-containing protein [Streptomyces sp. NPDC127097]|uniref:SHOCT domain-containing protein n=1 Tax=Streptomyces sp. NPDC127097 TaxID=3347136 RepID=UPI003667D1CD
MGAQRFPSWGRWALLIVASTGGHWNEGENSPVKVVRAMMYWDGGGWAWMAFMPLVWIVLIGLVVWVVIRLAHGSSGTGTGTGAREGERRESPQEILDRRFALGEIDTDTYSQAKKRLAEHQPGSR